MKKCILFITMLLFSSVAWGKTFYMSFYQSGVRGYNQLVEEELSKLYSRDENQREDTLEQYSEIHEQQLHPGDIFFTYKVLSAFIVGENAPTDLMADEDYKEDVDDLREDALELLIDEAQNSDRQISEREFALHQIAIVAKSNQTFEIDQNMTAVKALIKAVSEDHLILKHAAMVGLRESALFNGEEWEDVVDAAADGMTDLLNAKSMEVQRLAFIECLNFLQRAEFATDGAIAVWEATAEALSDIDSPRLKKAVHDRLGLLVNAKAGSSFDEQVKEVREILEETKIEKVVVSDPFEEVLASLESETDAEDVEPILETVMNEAKKSKSGFYRVYTKLILESLKTEIPDYKLRLLNDALVELTHSAQSTLYFNHTSSLFLQQLYFHRNFQTANVPLVMLGNFMGSTDYEQLLIPVIHELKALIEDDQPIWIQRRIIGLIFIQAGDSPNIKVAMEAARQLVEIAKTSEQSAIRWEAYKRLEYLSKYAKEIVVKKYASNWK